MPWAEHCQAFGLIGGSSRTGSTRIARRSGGWFVVLALLFFCGLTPAADPRDLSKAIDARIAAPLAKANLDPAPPAAPPELLRRVYLDVLGRPPTPDEATAYLTDPAADRHHKLIDALLARPEMPVYWRGVFHGWLNGNLSEKRPGETEFLAFLEKRLADNAGWDKIARELLEPSDADPVSAGAAYFVSSRLTGGTRDEQLDAVTVAVSGTFFGVQMQCAKCHDHPSVDAWKQENYYGLAAYFARTFTAKGKANNQTALADKGDAVVKFVGRKKGEQTARLLFLDGTVSDSGGGRKALAEVGVNARSPYFKRAMANRLWKQLMGVGLVEPVDQIVDPAAASHPELLADLSDDFANNGFDLRRLMGGILHSDAYLRTSAWTGLGPRPEPTKYAVGAVKPLAPPQLAAALAQATGHLDTVRAKLEKDKAKYPDGITPTAVRKQWEKEQAYTALLARFKQEGEPFRANAAHALYLSYNPTMKTMLGPTGLVGRLAKLKADDEVAKTAYLAALSRTPTSEEAAAVGKHLGTRGVSREELCRDVLWALVSGSEFRFNH